MVCKKCKERIKNWNGSDPKCAFPDGVFNTDNWNCATMNELRGLCEESYCYNNDQYAALLEGAGCDFVLLTWYKHRGRTNGAYQLTDNACTPLTIKEAEEVIYRYKNGIG